MPDFTVKEVHLPELHLPEIKRDEIVRALSGIHVPEVDLAKVEPRRRLRGVNIGALRSGRRTLSGADVGRIVAATITAARIVRPRKARASWSPFRRSRWSSLGRSRDDLIAVVRPAPRRSRRRLAAIVIAVTAAACWMLFRSPSFRTRLDRAASGARRRIDEMRSGTTAGMDLETGEPVPLTAAEATPNATLTSVSAEAEAATKTGISEQATNPV